MVQPYAFDMKVFSNIDQAVQMITVGMGKDQSIDGPDLFSP